MSSRIVRLPGGVAVEVSEGAALPPAPGRTSAIGFPDPVERGIEAIKPTLLRVCQPIVEAWTELKNDVAVSEAEIEFGLCFEGEGRLFVSKLTAGANLVVKLRLRPQEKTASEPTKIRKRGS